MFSSCMSSGRTNALTLLLGALYNHNPFYLIGTFLVLFGVQQSASHDASLAQSGMLVGLLAGYTLLLAAVATIIIRLGKVWEDARTILLVIVLMFFMLSTSLDVHILYDPLPGTLLLAGGLIFSVAVSEGLLRGLGIRLASQYRGPYYLMLTLLFGYPVALAWISRFDRYTLLSWALFAFPALAALALLTLLPAARTRRRQEPASNTPWPWPYYPWSLFVFLTIGIAIRAWWLTIAFEPTEGEDSAFRWYFLSPLVLAWAALLIEMGRARRNATVQWTGMALPLVTLLAAFPGSVGNAVEGAFVAQLVAAIGSPAQIAVWSLLLFYAWAMLRHQRGAEAFTLAVAGLASLVGPQTFDPESFTRPQPLVVVAIVVFLFVQALRKETSWRAVVAGGLVLVGFQQMPLAAASDTLWFWQWHAPALAIFCLAAIFNDRLAVSVREVAWRAAPCLAVIAAAAYPWLWPGVGEAALASYGALLLLIGAALWYRQKETGPLAAACFTLGANLASHSRHLYEALAHTPLAEGLPWLASGMLIVVLAFGISLLKMGLWHQSWLWLEKANQAMGGTNRGDG